MTVLEAFQKGLDITPVNSCSKSLFQFNNKDSHDGFGRFLKKERHTCPDIDSDMHNDTPNIIDKESFKSVLDDEIKRNNK